MPEPVMSKSNNRLTGSLVMEFIDAFPGTHFGLGGRSGLKEVGIRERY